MGKKSDKKPANRPTPERVRHADGHAEFFATDGPATVRFTDSPLDRLMSQGKLDKPQYDAGNKLYTHFFQSGISQDRARSLQHDRVDCEGGQLHETESQLYHRQEFNAALKILSGSVVGIVLAVVLEQRPLEQAGAFSGYTSKQGKITAGLTALRIGLSDLAEHFNLVPRRRYSYARTADGYGVEVREDLHQTGQEEVEVTVISEIKIEK